MKKAKSQTKKNDRRYPGKPHPQPNRIAKDGFCNAKERLEEETKIRRRGEGR